MLEGFEVPPADTAFLHDAPRFVADMQACNYSLRPASAQRQLNTAAEILRRLSGDEQDAAQRGVLLADDVGLGKTLIASLVAFVVATRAPRGGTVRILAPNDTVKRDWEMELKRVGACLARCSPHLVKKPVYVRGETVSKLHARSIHVTTHHYASRSAVAGQSQTLRCDLLIVDEAHRAKGAESRFSAGLRDRGREARRVLILTATPFSIEIDELNRMLALVGGEAAAPEIEAYKRLLNETFSNANDGLDPYAAAQRLATAATAATAAMRPWVIRHSLDDLAPIERREIGESAPWPISASRASAADMTMLIRMDRAATMVRRRDSSVTLRGNDPRLHVGVSHFDQQLGALAEWIQRDAAPHAELVASHVDAMRELRKDVEMHPKMTAVLPAIRNVVDGGEKVLVFCHHIATANELTKVLARELPRMKDAAQPSAAMFDAAWRIAIVSEKTASISDRMRAIFIEWLCTAGVTAQTWAWIRQRLGTSVDLVTALRTVHPRNHDAYDSHGTIAAEAQRLLVEMVESPSARGVLEWAASQGKPEQIPGAAMSAVLGMTTVETGESHTGDAAFVHNRNPDAVKAIFNSPFGPDVLIVTDRMSEGVSLHRYCRHLMHYELDASPIRTVQRNGRVRRIDSWAACVGAPVQYAYPAFGGTRDEKLVRIMRGRVAAFSTLLGGVPDIATDVTGDGADAWRDEVLSAVRKLLDGGTMSLALRHHAPL